MGTRAEEFWSHVDQRGPDECWPWTAAVFQRTGYGQVRWDGRPQGAHRVALQLTLGRPLRLKMDACHTCEEFNPLCCNPAHLYEGTRKQNAADAKRQGRLSTGPEHAASVKNRARGERNGVSKLTDSDIPLIRERIAAGESYRSIGRAFGVTHHVISNIASGAGWSHVQGGN